MTLNIPHKIQAELCLRKVQFHQQSHAQDTCVKGQRFAWVLDAVHRLLEQEVLPKIVAGIICRLKTCLIPAYLCSWILFLAKLVGFSIGQACNIAHFLFQNHLLLVQLPKFNFVQKKTRCLPKFLSAVGRRTAVCGTGRK